MVRRRRGWTVMLRAPPLSSWSRCWTGTQSRSSSREEAQQMPPQRQQGEKQQRVKVKGVRVLLVERRRRQLPGSVTQGSPLGSQHPWRVNQQMSSYLRKRRRQEKQVMYRSSSWRCHHRMEVTKGRRRRRH
jgi:hypothetical protein